MKIDGSDKALRRRFKICKFRNTFTENPDPNNSNEKLIDMDLKNAVSTIEYKLAFFNILLKHYKMYLSENKKIIMPKTFLDDTEEYFKINSPVENFMKNDITITGDKNDFIKATVLFDHFVSLYKGDLSNVTMQSFKEILLKNPKILHKHTKYGNGYIGIKLPSNGLEFVD